MEIQWTEIDEETGSKRIISAAHFARRWAFKVKARRREDWQELVPTLAIWETLRDALSRRYQRREGVSERDVQEVDRILAAWREPPSI